MVDEFELLGCGEEEKCRAIEERREPEAIGFGERAEVARVRDIVDRGPVWMCLATGVRVKVRKPNRGEWEGRERNIESGGGRRERRGIYRGDVRADKKAVTISGSRSRPARCGDDFSAAPMHVITEAEIIS